MYYLAVTQCNSLLEKYKSSTTYWCFDNLEQLNIAAYQCISARHKVFKKDIPVDAAIKTFSHFKDIGYKGGYLKMIENKPCMLK